MSVSGIGCNQILNNLQTTKETHHHERVCHREGHHEEDDHRAHHSENSGAHGLVKSVLQTLKDLGVIPSANETPSTTSTNSGAVGVSITLEITTISITSSTFAADAATDPNAQAADPAAADPNASTTVPASTAPADGATTGSATSTGSGMREIRAALHAFMHSLVQALNQVGSGGNITSPADNDNDDNAATTATSATPLRAAYGNAQSSVQGLADSLEPDQTPSTGSPLEALSRDFQALLDALGATTPAQDGQAASAAVSLESFLQTLAQNFSNTAGDANAGGIGIPGALVSSAA